MLRIVGTTLQSCTCESLARQHGSCANNSNCPHPLSCSNNGRALAGTPCCRRGLRRHHRASAILGQQIFQASQTHGLSPYFAYMWPHTSDEAMHAHAARATGIASGKISSHKLSASCSCIDTIQDCCVVPNKPQSSIRTDVVTR